MDKKPPNTLPMTPLGRLIADTMAAKRLTFAEVERRGGPKRTTLNALKTKSVLVDPPKQETILQIARGLGVPRDTVRDAVAASIGLKVVRDEGSDLRLFMDEAEERLTTPEKREAFIRSLRSVLDVIAELPDNGG